MKRLRFIFYPMIQTPFFKISILSFFVVTIITACDSSLNGSFKENLPPKTHLTVKQINRDENRLNSQINISWWGEDPDGYVVGFEFSIGGDTVTYPWVYTTSYDSTFVLPIPPGELEADIQFQVRAIDNEGLRDPVGASLQFPIKNSPPEVSFNAVESPPDTTFNVFSFGLVLSDPDGKANLNRIEIALNDKNEWIQVSTDHTLITMISSKSQMATGEVSLFSGSTLTPLESSFNNLKFDDTNTLYIRAFDNAEAVSKIDSLSWFVKSVTSRILVVNDFESATVPADRYSTYKQYLTEAGITTYDELYLTEGSAGGNQRVLLSESLPDISLTTPTITTLFAQWDFIIWFSSDLDRNISYTPILLPTFLGNGGKLFINVPSRNMEEDHPTFSILPIAGYTQLPSGARSFQIRNDSTIRPLTNISYPVLEISSNISSRYPLIASSGATELYIADFRVNMLLGNAQFEGNEVIAVKSAEENIIYFSLELSNINKAGNMGDFLKVMTIDELGFQPN